mmetsp:Transcript_36315/g.107216  ORF Transcript_36315/g.107216 Transcript_36315/m.107216 type:complete len:370 (-) Transcript_36315:196-1305(-)
MQPLRAPGVQRPHSAPKNGLVSASFMSGPIALRVSTAAASAAGMTSVSPPGPSSKPASFNTSTLPSTLATRAWNAAFVILMVRNLSSEGLATTLPMYFKSVDSAALKRSLAAPPSSCAFFMPTSTLRTLSSTLTGRTATNALALRSSSAFLAASASAASRAFSSSVGSSGRPSLRRRSRRSSSRRSRIFSLARASSSFSKRRKSSARFLSASSAFCFAASISLPERMRSSSRWRSASFSSRSLFSLAFRTSSSARFFASSGESLGPDGLLDALATISSLSRSGSLSLASSQLMAPSTVLLPEKCSARTARLCGKPMDSSSAIISALTSARTISSASVPPPAPPPPPPPPADNAQTDYERFMSEMSKSLA